MNECDQRDCMKKTWSTTFEKWEAELSDISAMRSVRCQLHTAAPIALFSLPFPIFSCELHNNIMHTPVCRLAVLRPPVGPLAVLRPRRTIQVRTMVHHFSPSQLGSYLRLVLLHRRVNDRFLVPIVLLPLALPIFPCAFHNNIVRTPVGPVAVLRPRRTIQVRTMVHH